MCARMRVMKGWGIFPKASISTYLLSLFINCVVDLRWAWRITEYLSNYLTEAYKIIVFIKHLRFSSHCTENMQGLDEMNTGTIVSQMWQISLV